MASSPLKTAYKPKKIQKGKPFGRILYKKKVGSSPPFTFLEYHATKGWRKYTER